MCEAYKCVKPVQRLAAILHIYWSTFQLLPDLGLMYQFRIHEIYYATIGTCLVLDRTLYTEMREMPLARGARYNINRA